jgi:GntR family transcriptional regulator
MADPMYRQIAEDLRHQIETGELPPGSQLRTEIELRETYNASRNTVRDAIKVLTTRGLVESRPGQGTFVVEKIEPFVTTLTGDPNTSESEGDTYSREVAERLRKPRISRPRVEIQQADDAIAADLQVSHGSTVVSRHQLRFIDETPWSLQTSFYPMSLVEQGATHLLLAQDISQGAVAYLRDQLGIQQVGYRDRITVRTPNEPEGRFFRLPDDGRVPVIEISRTAFEQTGKPVRLTVSVYPADRNQFAVSVGFVPDEVTAAIAVDAWQD